ncbi:peroxiredoxin [Psychroflexus torquis ATCC 700755]|uniref:thioredoxin-dependent peroxiredoxin n=1 Tax=Psychroflexus torquis (strain ATCC 700755 / CIP 106069 / ACAM 623) TaxID=313595 RepID=K4IB70_PSYTT|nr:peroxiredoxin [Psychroflexus torquis]AFU67674.1 peroxiredoxin [Psychroflexus torquis ATCC 700755]
MSIEKGDSIPSFQLNDQNGIVFNSDDVIGKKPVVIYFYPKNFTPGCTKEACSFRDSYEDFKEIGAEVVGISGDSEKSHAKFTAKYNLPFILLADSTGKVRKKFGIKKSLLGLVPGRETFVIDAQGKLIFKFNSLDASQHMKKALKAIKKIN